ncbi:MAG: hypothetical protein K2I87_01635 [Bacteroidales bacterium]|nr:hypothetical protein [Bacteroidales bacterium]
MSSKGYRRFKSRLDYFRTDKEFVNILVLNKELLKDDDTIFQRVDAAKHPLLFNRKNNAHNRELVVNHLRRTIYVAFIKDMYEEVTEYMRYILQEGAMNGANTDRLVGEHKVNMNANDILAISTKKEIVQKIMAQIFQQLENKRSTLSLISKINKKLDLSIKQQLIDKALPFLEIRHILVHSDGKPDQAFLKKNPTIEVDKEKKIVLNATFIEEAYDAVNSLLVAIDEAMEAKNYFSAAELQPHKKNKILA